MNTSVAVIGAGAMGGPIARRLHQSGFGVTVCDADPDKRAQMVDVGLVAVDEAGLCARADVVLVLVASVEQVRAVTVGDAGLLSQIDASDPPSILVMSTVPAECVLGVASDMVDSGARVLDAPVSGGVLRAENGTLTVMIGGSPEDVKDLGPVLDVISSTVFHCGPLGSASTTKIVNNIVGTASALVMAEACRIAVSRGLDLDRTIEVLDASSGRTYLSTNPGEATRFFHHITRRRADFDALVAIMRKDFGLAVDLAGNSVGTYPLLERLKEFADGMGDETYENWRIAGQPEST